MMNPLILGSESLYTGLQSLYTGLQSLYIPKYRPSASILTIVNYSHG